MTTIAFYLDTEDELLHACARKCVASARKHMPEAHIVQLGASSLVEGANEIIPHEAGKTFVERRLTAHSALEGDCIFVDVDVVFQADVRDVFAYEFDVAVTTDTKPGSPKVRFDGGVTFSRNPAVWTGLREHIGHLEFKKDGLDWQPIMEAQTAFFEKRLFKTLVLPGEIYCRVPETRDDLGAKIVHYRGPRKEWM